MDFIAGLGPARVSDYRAYVIGKDGRIVNFRAVCDSDADATVWAKQLVDCNDIELWSGDRFVTRLNSIGKPGAVTHEIHKGRMIPKPAK
jgi:hypothetical protein